jgi:hypothetical protein
MTIFTRHPHDQGISYLEHWGFAMGIAWRLLRSVVAFAVHALMPWITIEKRLDLEATSAFLLERNEFIETAANRSKDDTHPGAAPVLQVAEDEPNVVPILQ